MTDVTPRRATERPHMARVGRAEAMRALGGTETKILAARKTIETEIEHNDGIYPANDGVLNMQEVLRRAGLSKSALEKKRHAATKAETLEWIKAVTANKARGHKAVRKVVTARVDDAKEQLRKIQDNWHLAELEHNETLHDLKAAQARIEELEKEVAKLTMDLSDGKVISLKGSKR